MDIKADPAPAPSSGTADTADAATSGTRVAAQAVPVHRDERVITQVMQYLESELPSVWLLASDDKLKEVFGQLAQLPTDELQEALRSLDANGDLDAMVEQLAAHRQAFEQFFTLLESRGLIVGEQAHMKAGTYGVTPPVLYRAAEGVELPAGIMRALDQQRTLANQFYEAQYTAFAKQVTAARSEVVPGNQAPSARPAWAPPVSDKPRPPTPSPKVEEPAAQPGLARTPEEAARFKLGTFPTVKDVLKSPADAFIDGARWVAGQDDLFLRMQALEVGDAFEVEVSLGAKGAVSVERQEKDKYEITLSFEALFGKSLDVGIDLGLLGFEASLGSKSGAKGSLKLQVASPDELQQLLMAIQTRLQLDGKPKDAAQMKALQAASEFIKAHVSSATVGLAREVSAGVSLSVGRASLSGEGQLAGAEELEVSRAPDGRKALTARKELEVTSSVEAALDVTVGKLKTSGEKVNRITIERTHLLPPKPGETATATVKIEIEDNYDKRSELGSVSFTFPAEELPAWETALRRSDPVALRALIKKAKSAQDGSTVYKDERSFLLGKSTTTRVMKDKSR